MNPTPRTTPAVFKPSRDDLDIMTYRQILELIYRDLKGLTADPGRRP